MEGIVADMETRLTKAEEKLSLMESSNIRLEGKIDLILYQLTELKKKALATQEDVENSVAKEIHIKKKDCAKDFVSRSEYPVLWREEHLKNQSAQSKIIKAVFWVLGVIVTTVATITSGLAELITK